jgi:hypothetical protein
VHNDKTTHVREGATELGQDGPGTVGPGRPRMAGLAHPEGRFDPPFLEREDLSTLIRGGATIHMERATRPRGRPQARERERRGGRSFAKRIALLEGSNHKWRRTSRPCQDTPGGEGRHCRKRHHDQWCYA